MGVQIANYAPLRAPIFCQPRLPGKSTAAGAIDPVNRKATRIFNSLFRRRKLKYLSSTHMFTPGFVRFCGQNLRENW